MKLTLAEQRVRDALNKLRKAHAAAKAEAKLFSASDRARARRGLYYLCCSEVRPARIGQAVEELFAALAGEQSSAMGALDSDSRRLRLLRARHIRARLRAGLSSECPCADCAPEMMETTRGEE
jgi:predicted trehalose synthase